jgi:hypothetical protein
VPYACYLAKKARSAIKYKFRQFAHELLGSEHTEREPRFFCKIADNMQTPLDEFKAIMEEDDDGMRIIKASTVDSVYDALKPHRRVMLSAFIEALAEMVCSTDREEEDEDGEPTPETQEEVENILLRCVNLK